MISVRNLTKIYANRKNYITAVNDVSLDFPQNGMVFVAGESGCGKSTLLNLIGGLDTASSGEVFFEGRKLKSRSLHGYRNRAVGIVFQKFNLIDTFSVEENLKIVFEISKKQVDTSKINSVLQLVGLSGYNNRSVRELSGGEEQRLAIARALITDCKVLLADEPTGNLDTANSVIVLDLLKNISKQILVIVVSHEQEHVRKYADRIIVMKEGKIISDRLNNQGDEDEFKVKDNIGYITKSISQSTIAKINNSNCKEFKLIDSDEYNEKIYCNKILTDKIYDDNILTRLSLKTSFKIAFGSIFYHKIRFVALIIASILVFSLFGTSLMLGNYNIGAVAETILRQNNENALIIAKGQAYPPFGYTDTKQRYMYSSDDEKFIQDLIGENHDKNYMLLGSLYINNNESNNELICNTFRSYTETTEKNLNNYNFSISVGNFPKIERKNNFLQVAITDYTAYVIQMFGAYFSDGKKHNNFELGILPEQLVGRFINFGSEIFYVSGIIDTDFEKYKSYITGDENITQELKEDLIAKIDCYYSVLYFAKGATKKLYSKFQKYSDTAIMTFDAFSSALNGNTLNGENSNKRPPTVVWSNGVTSLSDDAILLTESIFRELFQEAFNQDKEYKYILNLNSGMDVFYRKEVKVVGIISSVNLDYMPHSNTLVLSENLFDEFVNGNALIAGYNWFFESNEKSVAEVINAIVKKEMYHISIGYNVLYEMYTMMNLYKNIFMFSSILLFVIACAIIFDFFRTNIKDREKDIGILMALGLSGKTSSHILLMQILIVLCILIIAIILGIFIFSSIMDMLLYATLAKGLLNQIIAKIPTVIYKFTPFAITICVLCGAILLSTSCLIAKIVKKKPIDNIRG